MTIVQPFTGKATQQWFADLLRVIRDVRAEGLAAEEYDCAAIAEHLRGLAGDRHLDTVADDQWTDALAWHRRAPFPVGASR
ncbi:hypothetical protein [Williamsia sp. 1135]|uniref:hypothetical protein n=1 Tax=Williamsia sp. 1135 TaxID=1889262 RepID=UPI000A116204|nr:hypothetical protein [Williamsia sp. 1135]ORM38169.1 hypothetical protein BFL43_00885 [Williamsia sp. 1135]